MRRLRSVIAYSFVALAAWAATAEPSQAGTGTVRIVLGTASFVVGTGGGKGTLTYQGKTYQFAVTGLSFGASLSETVGVLEGLARNLHSPEDLAGSYVAVGVAGAIVAGGGVARLRNAKRVSLVLRGPKVGAGFSVNLAHVTITMT
ncbi:hypothetical protein JQ615_17810 [Bradyrhizobium jicamae]|uniref:DUF992 domain-containing protein n=1 Tax=Bradyrhizobium jicamae TaxID=280332 RepID=A0ABS5FKE2_9BRAD|nr:hypothetical protein [Bradyrhizobium jicamae]MBR0797250.1 hypothetical protein [Bradyrhizobium jicamae]